MSDEHEHAWRAKETAEGVWADCACGAFMERKRGHIHLSSGTFTGADLNILDLSPRGLEYSISGSGIHDTSLERP